MEIDFSFYASPLNFSIVDLHVISRYFNQLRASSCAKLSSINSDSARRALLACVERYFKKENKEESSSVICTNVLFLKLVYALLTISKMLNR